MREVEAQLDIPRCTAPARTPTRPAALAAERDTLQSQLADAYAAWERVGEELAGV
jgi:hypothetical protein